MRAGFLPLDAAWSDRRARSAGVVALPGDSGVSLGPRLFGGGACGMRGSGAISCRRRWRGRWRWDAIARPIGRSLVESSVELRYLPFRKQYGATVFVDAGAAGPGTNAFENGISVAAGLGGRIRTWYLPIAIDVAYRIVDENRFGGGFDRLLAFLRIGEAF
jgi:outer membrane protein assembly factor BamA